MWRTLQRQAFTSLDALSNFLSIEPKNLEKSDAFPLLVPRRLAEKMEKGNIDDPLYRQFAPTGEKSEGGLTDPVGDCAARKGNKLLHKYEGRALLVTTSACAMHCRYCFRQHFDYSPSEGFAEELALIRAEPSLREIILSGGDPLSLSNRVLSELIEELESIPHLTRLRFHTRFPIGIPERIDPGFLKLLETSRFQTYFVIHCNHQRELDHDIFDALKKIQRLGIPVLNQAVLLKGVNDSVEVLQALSETLVDQGILPYYLHQLDRVEGALHFEVEAEKGKALVEALSQKLSGYGVPKYVREVAGERSKSPIF